MVYLVYVQTGYAKNGLNYNDVTMLQYMYTINLVF